MCPLPAALHPGAPGNRSSVLPALMAFLEGYIHGVLERVTSGDRLGSGVPWRFLKVATRIGSLLLFKAEPCCVGRRERPGARWCPCRAGLAVVCGFESETWGARSRK